MPKTTTMPGALLTAGVALFSSQLLAQPIGLPQKRPAEEALEVPPYAPEQEAPPLQLPELPQFQPDERLSALPGILVRRIELFGNSVFDAAALAHITGDYENRSISAGELQELRYRLTLFYVRQGYINSGAVIPDQTVEDGVIRIDIIEGELSEVMIDGNRHLASDYIGKRIALDAGPPLNIRKLGERLQILQQNPRIRQLTARLMPGIKPGEAILDVDIEEEQRYQVWVGGNNHQPPSVGGNQGWVRALNQDLTSRGDTLAVEYDLADGLDEWEVSYTLPVTARDTEFGVLYNRIDSKVVENPFDVLDIESEETTLGVSLTHPFYRTLNRNLSMGLFFDLRRSKNFLLDQRFDFTPASENGKVKLSVVRFSQEWLDRQRNQVFAARSLFSRGVDVLDASVNGARQDGRYTSWLGQLQWVRRLGQGDARLVVRADAQWTPNSLPSMEQFTIGGANSVRGYRENRLITDKGVFGSVELRYPVYTSPNGFELQLAPFVDFGKVANNDLPDPKTDRIVSAGIGLLGSFARRFQFDVYYGHPFQDFDDANDNIQDDGVHFNVSARLF
jgi:hemolysin activation/secretion protein